MEVNETANAFGSRIARVIRKIVLTLAQYSAARWLRRPNGACCPGGISGYGLQGAARCWGPFGTMVDYHPYTIQV